MTDEYEDVTVDGGKYTIRLHADGTVEAGRYSETWISQLTAGANMVRALAVEVGLLRAELGRVKAERDAMLAACEREYQDCLDAYLDGRMDMVSAGVARRIRAAGQPKGGTS